MASDLSPESALPEDLRPALEQLHQLAQIVLDLLGREDLALDRVRRIVAKRLRAWSGAAQQVQRWRAMLEAKLKVARAAEAQWRYFARVLDDVTFQNAAGELAHVPFALVRLLAAGATLPFVVELAGTDVVYRRGTTLFCRVPRTLHVVLKDLIAGRPWETPGK